MSPRSNGSPRRAGLALTVKKPDGSVVDLSVKDGPVYPMLEDDIPLE